MATSAAILEPIVLELLGSWVRFLSVDQVASLVPGGRAPKRAAERLVKRMEQAGLLERFTLMARAPLDLGPLFAFSPGDPEPDFRALSLACRERWTQSARPIHVVRLSRAAAKALGCPRPRTVRASETTHDLQMAEVTLAFWCKGQVAAWSRDDALATTKRWGDVVPDAEAQFTSGERLVIECGGTYSAKKLEDFHTAITARMQQNGAHGYQIF